MGRIFNNGNDGNGGAKCDKCGIILFVGNTHRREQCPYVEEGDEFFCDPTCLPIGDDSLEVRSRARDLYYLSYQFDDEAHRLSEAGNEAEAAVAREWRNAAAGEYAKLLGR